MDIFSVPPSIRHFYAAKLDGLHLHTLEAEAAGIDPVHIIDVLLNLELEMHLLICSDSELVRPTHHSTARPRVIFSALSNLLSILVRRHEGFRVCVLGLNPKP